MNAKLARMMALAAGLLASAAAPGGLEAAAPACIGKSGSCLSGPRADKAQGAHTRLAQVPSMTDSGPRIVINQPKAAVPRKAFKALDKHCARCHQNGRLERSKPAESFGNILKLDEIAGDPHLILPGNPDGSRLFSRIVKQEMPYDVYTEFSGGNEPSKEDVQAIYDWIESLDPKIASCASRKPVDTSQVVADILAHLNKQSAGRRKGMRYLTLTNLYNACAKSNDMRRMQNGATVLLNSLSRAAQTTKTSLFGTGGSIIAFNIDDLGWSPEDWETLVAAYPYGVRPKSQTFEQVKATTKASLPYLRADWFAVAASNPPLYYKLLDLPEDLPSLQAKLGVDAERNIADGNVMRAGIENSPISRYNRIAERHTVGDGYLWMTYDFNGGGRDKTITERPLGPGGDRGFVHDMNALIFSLPNGMNAYYLADEEGNRVDAAAPDILYDEATPRRPVVAALACMSCHTNGVRRISDTLRAHVEASGTLSAAERDDALRLYVEEGELDRQVRDDQKRFRNAAANAGIKMAKGNDGVDDLNYLASRYDRDIDLRIAAAEYGVTSGRYSSGIVKGDGEARRTKQQLEQGTMTRRQIEPLFLKHVALVSADVPTGRVKAPASRPAKPPLATAAKPAPRPAPKPAPKKPAKAPPPVTKKDKPAAGPKVAAIKPAPGSARPKDEQTISLVSDKVRYRANDLPVFTVRTSSDCELTLINVDPAGHAVVIFPNKYQQENTIKGGQEFQFPGPDAPFQFRLKDIGKEKLVAECAITRGGERIQHNFEQQEFTDLGDYRDHVGEQAEKNGGKKSASGAKTNLLRTAITFSVN